MYTEFTILFHGRLGKGNRRELPPCVVTQIRALEPNVDGEEYTGFIPVRIVPSDAD
jgi:hypothetical protein